MLKRFLDTTSVDALADALTEALRRAIAPHTVTSRSGLGEHARKRVAELIRKRVAEFAVHSKVNFYQKAHLGTRLEDALIDAGFAADFSKELAFEVVSQLAAATAGKR